MVRIQTALKRVSCCCDGILNGISPNYLEAVSQLWGTPETETSKNNRIIAENKYLIACKFRKMHRIESVETNDFTFTDIKYSITAGR